MLEFTALHRTKTVLRERIFPVFVLVWDFCCLRSSKSVPSCVCVADPPSCESWWEADPTSFRSLDAPLSLFTPSRHVSSGAPVTRTPQSVPQPWDFVLGSVLKCTSRWEISPEQSPEEAVLEAPQRDGKSLGSRGRSAILRARAGWRELLLVICQEPISQGWFCSLSSNSVPYLNFSLSHFLLRVSQR